MAKRRRYGDAWKDVQIDAEQNDAVFDRFFKRTQQETVSEAAPEAGVAPEGEGITLPAPQIKGAPAAAARAGKRPQAKASVSSITPQLPNLSRDRDAAARVDEFKRQYRLSKGEAAILRHLLDKAEQGGGSECYAKIPELADVCQMTHRGCQFALRNLETRGFITRLKDYDPADRLGTQFRITLPTP